MQFGGVPVERCVYKEGRQAGNAPLCWKPHGGIQWTLGPPQGQLLVAGAAQPHGSTLPQLLERLLPPCGLSLGALTLNSCELTPAQCHAGPLLEHVKHFSAELAVQAALISQMPALERLDASLPEDGRLPDCIVQGSSLRVLELTLGAGQTPPPGPYLQS